MCTSSFLEDAEGILTRSSLHKLIGVLGSSALMALTGACSPTHPSTLTQSSPSVPRRSTTVAATPVTGEPSAHPTETAGTGGTVTVTVSGLPSDPVLAPGGKALPFTVTIANPGPTAYADTSLVVSMGHCSCVDTPTSEAPQGTLQEWSPATGTWDSVRYVTEGTGMDFISRPQLTALSLGPGTSSSFTFRVRFKATQPNPVHKGQVMLDATLLSRAQQLLSPSSAASATFQVEAH